jgi:hypothetical protein
MRTADLGERRIAKTADSFNPADNTIHPHSGLRMRSPREFIAA